MRNNPKYLISYLLLLVFFSISHADGHKIKGNVVDIHGKAIPFATIFIKELAKGISTAEKGSFSIPLEAGTYTLKFQCVGYQPETRVVELSTKEVELNVVLQEMNYTLSEVVISGRENPANRIMRATITRSQFFYKMLESFNSEVYVKVNFKIDKLSMLVKYMTKDEKNMPQVGKLQFAESNNQVIYTAPDRYTQKVLKAAKSGTAFSPGSVPVVEFMTYSVYKPKYGDIPSPLGKNAFSWYNFSLAGISVMGNYSIYKISVRPKRPGMFFEGYIYINSNNYFVNNLSWTLDAAFQQYTLKMDFEVFQDAIALPSNYYIDFKFSLLGNEFTGMSSSSVRYKAIKLNEKARLYLKDDSQALTYLAETKKPETGKKQQKLEKEMNTLMNKKEMSLKDMNKFIRTMEKIDKANQKDTSKSLEVKDPVVVTKDSLYDKHDTSYWREQRPIVLSSEEEQAEADIDSTYLAMLNDTISAKQKKAQPKKLSFTDVVENIFLGGNVMRDTVSRFHLSGLLSNNTYFSPVDGFTLGTTLSYQRAYKNKERQFNISFTPSYSFSRDEFMAQGGIEFSLLPMKQGRLYANAFSKSNDYNTNYPADLFLNSLSCLILYDNKVKQIHDQGMRIGGSIEISNGLTLSSEVAYHKRTLLENTTNYSFSHSDSAYTANDPGNIFQNEHPLSDHDQMLLHIELNYTHRNKYKLKGNRKINLGSSYPTLGIRYDQGIKGNRSISDFSRFSLSLEQKFELGLFSELWYKASAGNAFHTTTLQLPDFYQPNVSSFAFELRDTKTSFVLLPSYVYGTPSWFMDAHFRYNANSLIIKRLPWIGEKLFTETLSLAFYSNELYRNYAEAGYGFGNLFFAGSIQAVVGFSDGEYTAWGIRAFFKIR